MSWVLKKSTVLGLPESAPCRESEKCKPQCGRTTNWRNQVKHEMTMTLTTWCSLVFALATIIFLGACAKKVAPPPPTPPPALTAPTASLSANPNTLDPGQSTTLTWQTTNATDVSIDGIGPVDPSGSPQATPAGHPPHHPLRHRARGNQ